MITVSALIKLAFQLNIILTFQSVNSDEFVVQYYNELSDTVVQCTPAQTEIGRVSICPTGAKEAHVYVIETK